MHNKNRIIIILILFIALISVITAIFLLIFSVDPKPEIVTLPQETIVPSCYLQEGATPDATLAPTATAIPERPKYIFYVIGDGMGFSHLALGAAYEKILHEDSQYQPYWERFDVKKSCIGGIESAKGGTMIATGYDGAQGAIAVDDDGNELITILDRAKEAGLSTGVISNSYIMDATPATFLAHTDDRGEYLNISNQIPFSDVDYIASGGMNYFLHESQKEKFGTYDIAGRKYIYKGDKNTLSNFASNGYSAYLAEDAARLAAQNKMNTLEIDKLFMLFVSKNMSYQRSKYGSRMEQKEIHEPDLDEMTQVGIDFLSQNENGFVFVIEEALIDKASHNLWMEIVAAEMHMMNETLEVIFDFYKQHPYETLIIFTADHETGDMSYDEHFISEISDLPDLNWHLEGDKIYSFLSEEWGVSLSLDKIEDKKEIAQSNIWGSDDKNYTLLHSYIASYLCKSHGITINSKYHSKQAIPLYTLGVKSDYFVQCENIYEISPIICKIMGWKELPEIVE